MLKAHEKGNRESSINILNACTNEVETFTQRSVLAADEGQLLLDTAEEVYNQLSAG
jgi:hypothetical protein